MNLNQALKSNDIEIVALYVGILLDKLSIGQINKKIKPKYQIVVHHGEFHLTHRPSFLGSRTVKNNIKLNYKSKDNVRKTI